MRPLIFTTLCFVLYFFCGAGYIDTVDADPSLDTAWSLVKEHRLSFIPDKYIRIASNPAPNSSGRYLSRMGLVMPLLYTGPVLVAQVLEGTAGFNARRWSIILVSIVNQAVSAGLLLLLYWFFVKFGFRSRDALLWCCVAGFATLLFPYSKTSHREPLLALLTLGAFGFCRLKKWFLCGLFLGVGFLTKEVWLLGMFPILIYIWHTEKAKSTRLTAFAPLLVAIVILQIHRYFTLGSFTRFMYSKQVINPFGRIWSTPLWDGVSMQWFSLSDGLLILSPILLFPLYLIFKNAITRRLTKFDLTIIASVLVTTFFYARWFSPMGGATIGPRYLVPVIPLFFFFIPPSFSFAQRKGLLVPLFLISFGIQIVNVSVRPLQYWVMADLLSFPPSTNHFLINAALFKRKMQNMPEHYNVGDFWGAARREGSLQNYPTYNGFNFWWALMKNQNVLKQLGE